MHRRGRVKNYFFAYIYIEKDAKTVKCRNTLMQ